MRVLLIGAATGYNAALLAKLGAEVHAVEEQGDLLAAARAAATAAGIRWIAGPLAAGAPKAAPFARLIIDGAIATLPDLLAHQTAGAGKMVERASLREGKRVPV